MVLIIQFEFPNASTQDWFVGSNVCQILFLNSCSHVCGTFAGRNEGFPRENSR